MMTKIPKQPKKTKQYSKKDNIDWLSEVVDMTVMFRIKGRPGLFIPASKPMKNGMLLMERFSTGDRAPIDKKHLLGLGNMAIETIDAGVVLPFTIVLDNLQKHMKNEPIPAPYLDNENIIIDEFMGKMCPDFDIDSFKVYHARKGMVWYNEIIKGIERASN